MANRLTKYLQRYSLYFISAVMGLGTINPLSPISSDEEAQSFLIYPAYALLIITYIISYKKKENINKYLRRGEISLILLWGTILFSGFMYTAFINDNISVDYKYSIKLLFSFIAYYIIGRLFIESKETNKCLLIYSIICVLILIPYMIHIPGINNFYRVSNGRLWMYGENPNTFSARLAIAAMYLLNCLITTRYKKLVKILFLSMIGLLIFFIILSGSRGSLAIVVLCALLMCSIDLPLWKLLSILSLIIIIMIIFLSGLTDEIVVLQRFESLSDKGDLREILMQYAINIWETYPIIGCGENGYLAEKIVRYGQPLDSHCIVTSILAMGGIVGLIFFISFIYNGFLPVWKIRKDNIFPLILFLFMLFISLKTGGIISYFLMYYIYAYTMSESILIRNQTIKTGLIYHKPQHGIYHENNRR